MKLNKRVVFYTDDDEDDRDMFRDAFHSIIEDCDIATQSTGYELLQLLVKGSRHPIVIFLDLNMPVKNGYEVLKEIRQSESITALPVVIFSTSDDIKAISASRKLGANFYISKPSSFSALKNAIKHTLAIDWKNFSPSPNNFVYRPI